ncbi:MAG: DNA-directed RNA polymerase subunit omega [Planctomycetota bacterium]
MSMDRNVIWEMSEKCGGVFQFTVLLQKRIRELVKGAPKLVDTSESNVIQVALQEIQAGKVCLEALTPEELEDMERRAAGEGLEAAVAAQEDEKPIDPTAAVRELLSR